jgi:hypothetical protein
MTEETWDEGVDRIAKQIRIKKPKYNEKDFRKWLNERKNLGFIPFDKGLMWKCYELSKKLQNDYDYWTVIAGLEGEGKSSLGIQIGSLVSKGKVYICFSPDDFYDAVRIAKKGETIQLDEGGVLLLSREAMSQTNRQIIKIGMLVRQKNLHVILCIPNFFLIDTYIRDHRVNLLIQIKKRGRYRGIFDTGIKTVSRDGWKYKNVIGLKIKPNKVWDGDFRKKIPLNFDYEAYLTNKKNHMDLLLSDTKSDSMGVKYVPASRVAKEIGVAGRTIRRWIEKKEISGKKAGALWFVSKASYNKLMREDVP